MLEFLKTPSGAYNLTFIVAILGWLVSGIGIFAGFHLNKVKALDAAEKARQAEVRRVQDAEELRIAKAEAAAAKKLADDLEAQQRPRILTVEQAKALRSHLSDTFPRTLTAPFIVASKMLDPESTAYARQIFEALPFPQQVQVFSESGILPFQGIRIFSVGEPATDSCTRIKAAFEVAHIPFSEEPFRPAACPIHPEVGVYIFVGYK